VALIASEGSGVGRLRGSLREWGEKLSSRLGIDNRRHF